MSRTIDATYRDPLELIWLGCAGRIGWTVQRSEAVYASWDGRSVLTVSDASDFDADDSLAQLIFHEICHALVEGRRGQRRVDWGLENIDDRDLVREHACHRLQAALADRYGLRWMLAVTTDWRPYYDALPALPLAPGDDPAIALARRVWPEALRGTWAPHIDQALAATAALAAAVRPFAPVGSLWTRAVPLHPAGFPVGEAGQRCGGCAWFIEGEGRCRQAAQVPGEAPRVDPDWGACQRWEPPLDAAACGDCGACCREAFHQVPVGEHEPLAGSPLVARDEYGLHLPRPGGRCVGLAPGQPYRCAVYERRPRSCRDFAVGGDSCLEARRRVGLSDASPSVATSP
jgi:hypothetical protein